MWRRLGMFAVVGTLALVGLAQAAPRTVVAELFSADN